MNELKLVDFINTVCSRVVIPGDYSAVTRTLTFSAGSTSSSVMLMAAEDNLSEPAETFSAVLRNPGSGLSLGTQDTATITIPQSDSKGCIQLVRGLTTSFSLFLQLQLCSLILEPTLLMKEIQKASELS